MSIEKIASPFGWVEKSVPFDSERCGREATKEEYFKYSRNGAIVEVVRWWDTYVCLDIRRTVFADKPEREIFAVVLTRLVGDAERSVVITTKFCLKDVFEVARVMCASVRQGLIAAASVVTEERALSDAVDALRSLGVNKSTAENAVKRATLLVGDGAKLEDTIAQAIRLLRS
jgi:hypothetical protein